MHLQMIHMHAAAGRPCGLRRVREGRAAPLPLAAPPPAAARSGRAPLSVSAGFQPPLTNKDRKTKRADAQRLGRNICTVNLGQKGMTESFLEGFRLAVGSNELVKVRVGSCDESVDEVAEALAAAGDCVLVHSIGSTLTFYREKNLPTPPAVAPAVRRRPQAAAAAAVAGAAAASGGDGSSTAGTAGRNELAGDEEVGAEAGDGAELFDDEVAAYLESEDAFSDSDSEGEEEEDDMGPPNSGRRQAAAARAAKANRPPPPPEFTVIK